MTDPQDLIKSATTISEAATPGPWEVIDDYDGVGGGEWRGMSCPSGNGGHGGDGLVFATHEWDVGLREGDIEFIATARTLVPELSAALEESTATVATLLGRHQVASIAVASGLEPNATLDELYEHLSELRQSTRERDEARAELGDISVCPACDSKDMAVRCRGCGRDW